MAGIEDLRIRETVRPLRTTFSTSRGRKQHLHSVIVRVLLDDGRTGTGEVPTSFTYPEETVEEIRRTLDAARAGLRGLPIREYRHWIDSFRARFPRAMMTVSGLEAALFRACLGEEGVSEHAYWGARETSLETDITIPMLSDRGLAGAWIDRAIRLGFSTYKLKVGGDEETDRRLVEFVHRTLASRVPAFRLRLDGNQGYEAAGFLRLLDHLERMRCDIELFEQPLRKDDFRGLEEIRGRSRFPIVLDEGVANVGDAERVIANGLCEGINVKIAKSGIGESRKIMELAGKNGLKLMMGCMTETMVGLSAAMFLALGTGAFDYIDLDGAYLLYGRREYPGLTLKGPVISAGTA